ncbi:hypothetical protein [Alsobacter sp. R-9]
MKRRGKLSIVDQVNGRVFVDVGSAWGLSVPLAAIERAGRTIDDLTVGEPCTVNVISGEADRAIVSRITFEVKR